VTRGSNLRLFSSSDLKHYNNCQPGTIIENQSSYNNFCMVTNRPNHGISTPTSYILAYDDNESNITDIYTIIHKLSYLYYNWLGPIKVPAPIQYAKKLIKQVRENLLIDKPLDEYPNKLKSLYFI
jgi:argonaute-like protein implicated in RNA metabolism and viral defense